MKESFEQMALRIKANTYPDWNVNIDRFLVEYATRLREELCKGQEPVAWMTNESRYRLRKGGNCKGAVPVHQTKSNISIIPLYLHPAIPKGEVVVTTDEQGNAVCVTRQDEEGRILSVIWMAGPPPEGMVMVPREPIVGKNYEAGLWSRRNWEAMLEDITAYEKEQGK